MRDSIYASGRILTPTLLFFFFELADFVSICLFGDSSHHHHLFSSNSISSSVISGCAVSVYADAPRSIHSRSVSPQKKKKGGRKIVFYFFSSTPPDENDWTIYDARRRQIPPTT